MLSAGVRGLNNCSSGLLRKRPLERSFSEPTAEGPISGRDACLHGHENMIWITPNRGRHCCGGLDVIDGARIVDRFVVEPGV